MEEKETREKEDAELMELIETVARAKLTLEAGKKTFFERQKQVASRRLSLANEKGLKRSMDHSGADDGYHRDNADDPVAKAPRTSPDGVDEANGFINMSEDSKIKTKNSEESDSGGGGGGGNIGNELSEKTQNGDVINLVDNAGTGCNSSCAALKKLVTGEDYVKTIQECEKHLNGTSARKYEICVFLPDRAAS